MLFADLVATSERVASVRGRRKKLDYLAALLNEARGEDIEIAIAFLSGEPRQGRLGVGPAALRDLQSPEESGAPSLELQSIDASLLELTRIKGKGSAQRRLDHLFALMQQMTAEEQDFFKRLLIGELRQGALAKMLIDAVAQAAGLDTMRLRRAVMVAGALAPVASAGLSEGNAGLEQFAIRPFCALQPMFAQPAADIDDAMQQLGRARLDYKLDGARVQVHKQRDEIRVYTRSLREVTAAVPEVVAVGREIQAEQAILDGEVIALKKTGRPHAFQTTMRRFGRSESPEALQQELPLSVFFFDLLYVDGATLLDSPAAERLQKLDAIIPENTRISRCVTGDARIAREFMEDARAAGHEGLMAKDLESAYAAGSRGGAWLKVKPVHTLDLVVLAAEWGSGRRRGWLSNLHLGARNSDGGFAMLGKTFKGLTDDMLGWQTEQLQQLETRRDKHCVYVRAELVVETAFNDVQKSPQYPGGVALRFARVKGYRPDKTPADADTLESVLAIHRGQTKD